MHLAFYRNGDPYSYASLEQHAAQITHLCPEWMSVVDGMGDLQIDADNRLPKLTAAYGIALMPLLTNLLGDKWQPEAIENLANAGRAAATFFSERPRPLRNARAAGVVIDWQEVDPAYLDRIGDFVGVFRRRAPSRWARALGLRESGRPLALSDSDKIVEKADRFVALLYDETSEDETPGALSSRPWFEGWLDSLLADGDPEQWIIGLGSYGYDWTKGQPKPTRSVLRKR